MARSMTYPRPSNARSPLHSPRARHARAGGREERGDARAPGADALRERALRRELDLDPAREHLLLEDLILAHVARDHLLHLAVLEQVDQAVVGGAGVVGDDGEVARALVAECGDAFLGNPAESEPAHEDRRAVRDVGTCGAGVGEDFVHGVTKKGATTQRRKDGRRLTETRQPPSVFPSFRLSDRPRYGLTTPLAFSSAAASMPVRPSKAATSAWVATLPGAPGA